MRIARATLYSRWAWTTGAGFIVFVILMALDWRLKALTGVGTTDLQGFSSAAQFRAAFWAWGPQPYAVRAGFDLGFDYLLMPLYAASFFYSGVICAEAFAPAPGQLRQWILRAAMVPLLGALCDGAENALHMTMMLGGASDTLAALAGRASLIKDVALVVGIVLLAGAAVARFRPKPKPVWTGTAP